MAIRPIQFNIEKTPSFKQKDGYKSYLEAEGAIKTNDKVKPLPPQGHLVHDKLGQGTKYFFKDIAYDIKAVKDGFVGKANDHQLGRLNDVGLRLGGIGIATYLASKTNNPKVRLMEYVGLATFLTMMSIYPKMAINLPAKIKHGFDVDKEYIDDQGRKKSVMQDANYIPYDMYRAEYSDEDLEKIGDRLGIPKNIKNRNEVVKEQMRKISTQNNTLWMLTAGFATPALTALGCNLLENYVVIPGLEKRNNKKVAEEIGKILSKTKDMKIDTNSLQTSNLSKNVETLLQKYKGQELPAEELQQVIKKLTAGLDNIAASGIEDDVVKIVKNSVNGEKTFFLNNDALEVLLNKAKLSVKANENIQKVVLPTKGEVEEIIRRLLPECDLSKGVNLSAEKFAELRNELNNLLEGKINSSGLSEKVKTAYRAQKAISLETISKNIKQRESTLLTEESIKKLVDFSKIISEFKENLTVLDRCKAMKFEYNPNSSLAHASSKFEKMVLKELGISFKDMKKMRESSEYTRKILDERITEICKDEARYKKFVDKIGKHMSQLEKTLNGSGANESQIKDLINAIEYNFNNTAKRLEALDKDAFGTTIRKLINEEASTAGIKIANKEQLFDFLDGLRAGTGAVGKDYVNGSSSSKNLMLNRIFSRYQGSKNIYNRFLHTLEIYQRALNPAEFNKEMTSTSKEYTEEVIKRVKDAVMEATSKKHTLKLDIVTDENLYRDVMDSMFKGVVGHRAKEKGFVTKLTEEMLKKYNGVPEGNILDRFQYYLARFKNIVANDTTDFTKPNHLFDGTRGKMYSRDSRTPSAIFDLIGQSPVEFAKGAAKNQYGTQKWLRIVGTITGSVFAVALLAQLGFGKLNNKHNLKRQVNENETK